jgi:hypothetical protein
VPSHAPSKLHTNNTKLHNNTTLLKNKKRFGLSIYNGIESGKEEEWCSLFQP